MLTASLHAERLRRRSFEMAGLRLPCWPIKNPDGFRSSLEQSYPLNCYRPIATLILATLYRLAALTKAPSARRTLAFSCSISDHRCIRFYPHTLFQNAEGGDGFINGRVNFLT